MCLVGEPQALWYYWWYKEGGGRGCGWERQWGWMEGNGDDSGGEGIFKAGGMT